MLTFETVSSVLLMHLATEREALLNSTLWTIFLGQASDDLTFRHRPKCDLSMQTGL